MIISKESIRLTAQRDAQEYIVEELSPMNLIDSPQKRYIALDHQQEYEFYFWEFIKELGGKV